MLYSGHADIISHQRKKAGVGTVAGTGFLIDIYAVLQPWTVAVTAVGRIGSSRCHAVMV